MIEHIKYKNQQFALIVRKKQPRKQGVNFFTPVKYNQQFSSIIHKKGYVIKPHLHNKIERKINTTSEVIIIEQGKLRVDFYNENKKYLFSKILKEGDIILLINGAHGFKIMQNTRLIEVKQGPYNPKTDKEKFEPIDEKKIKIK